ncbi:hypothetical protein [Halorientalis pallida]|uniref:Uncharacterized protein n=1 Tax=Halorientalis pallida TaxID=2479928 RepID=A0A498KYN4_9EURY|nr:hypothetical protein [Halorientalis pallida]RXK51138.1 hypothetical protein EAF64_00360 [Halorientalis pallida]
MSSSELCPRDRVRRALGRTRSATRLVFRRRDSQVAFVTVTAIYLLLYLWAIGHLSAGLGGFDLLVVSDPLSKLLRPELGPFSFTPVARLALGPVTYLFSLNSVLGLVLAGLVGVNGALTYLVWRQPRACGIGRSSTGLLASIPALLSGTACCGPVVLLVVGVQASGVLLTGFQLLLPVAVTVLLGSLVLVGRQVTVPE